MRNRSHHTQQPRWHRKSRRAALPFAAELAAEFTVSSWLTEVVPTAPEVLPDQPDGPGTTPLLDAAVFPRTPRPERPKRPKSSALSPEFPIPADPRQLAFIEVDDMLRLPRGPRAS